MISALTSSDKKFLCILSRKLDDKNVLEVYERSFSKTNTIRKHGPALSLVKNCASIHASRDSDLLLFRSQHEVLLCNQSLDVLFKKEEEEEISSACFGKYGSSGSTVVFVATQCCVRGFDVNGSEIYWNILPDIACYIHLLNNFDQYEILLTVALLDGSLNFYRGMSLNATIQETSNFQSLCFGKGNEFSFVLENNSIGVYKETEQLWKTKEKYKVLAQCLHYIKDNCFLATSWSNGKLDLRSFYDGTLFYKLSKDVNILSLISLDSKLVGFTEDIEFLIFTPDDLTVSNVNHDLVFEHAQEKLRKMLVKKQQLSLQLSYLKNRRKRAAPRCSISTALVPRTLECPGGVELTFEADVAIYAVVGRCEKLFLKKTKISCGEEGSKSVRFLITTPEDVPYAIKFQIFLQRQQGCHLDVCEITKELVPFCLLFPRDLSVQYSTRIKSETNLTNDHIKEWFSKNILQPADKLPTSYNASHKFIHLRDGFNVELDFTDNKFVILKSENLKVASDLFKSLMSSYSFQHTIVESKEIESVVELLSEADRIQAANIQLQLQMVSRSKSLKNKLVEGAEALQENECLFFNAILDTIDDDADCIQELTKQRKEHQLIVFNLLRKVNDIIQCVAACHSEERRSFILMESRRLIREKQFPLIPSILM
ncbi:Bardet-Biedl syndrome 2 protein homolog [Artemia franciscana]|uniref:Ciliary BBSome complex subunit 2 middle region domain-containing protein n=1 Tax=Artemia franciscana TaxID=6661 RepID=A0AA88IAM4_ARTSF|nr:hypothetical protein QYM36_003321 [Artemia franciscana]